MVAADIPFALAGMAPVTKEYLQAKMGQIAVVTDAHNPENGQPAQATITFFSNQADALKVSELLAGEGHDDEDAAIRQLIFNAFSATLDRKKAQSICKNWQNLFNNPTNIQLIGKKHRVKDL